MSGWVAERIDDGSCHVWPIYDLRPHEQSETCWCRPRIDDGIVVHNSMDRREEYERGDRKLG